MKVVLLTNILSPYRKVFYDKLYSDFKKLGVDFKVLVMAETEPDREWHYIEYRGEYSELLISKTFSIHHICFHFNKNLSQRLKEIDPDILIASGSYISPSVIKSILMKRKMKYKLIFWSESHLNELRSYSRMSLWIRELLRKKIYQRFDGFWYAGSKSLEFIRKYDDNKRREDRIDYYFIPNLVDHSFYQKASELELASKLAIRTCYQISTDRFIFVLPARLTTVKGIMPFIKLFDKSEYKDKVTILILGEGKLRSELQQLIDRYGLDIRLLGYKKQEDTLTYYSIADCFLLPSLSDPNPLSCIEALWAGLPLLVSTHVGNYPEAVRIGENGYVFDYEHPEDAIRLINTIINSSEEWRKTAKFCSLSIAKDHYEPDKAVFQLVNSMMKDLDYSVEDCKKVGKGSSEGNSDVCDIIAEENSD